MYFWMESSERLRTCLRTTPAERRLCVAASLWLALILWQMSKLGKNDRTWDRRCLDGTMKLHIWLPCGETRAGGCREREIERMGKNEVVLFLSLQWFHNLIVMYTTFDRNGKHWHYGIVSTTVSEWTTELCKIHTPHDKPIVLSGWSHAKRQIIFFASKSQYIFTVVLTLKSKMPPDLFVSPEINWRACLLWALMS